MKNLKIIFIIFQVLVVSLLSVETSAQLSPTDSIPPDPARISVYSLQNLKFGAFTQGALGGSIVMSPEGVRTASGDVILLNMGIPYNQSIFEVEGIVGTVVSILNGPNTVLTGSNGGSLTMEIGTSSPSSPFYNIIPPPGRTQVNIGGTLIVGTTASNPPGIYTGTFFITFNQE